MEGLRITEEMIKMKVRLLALAFGFFLVAGTAVAGPVSGGGDTDGDTVQNAFDNCSGVSNASQTDTDHNGCGDGCTQSILCDGNGDTIVGGPDFTALGMEFGRTGCGTTNTCTMDCNGDTVVGGPDFTTLGMEFGNTVGPSGITTAQCDPSSCRCTPQ
jgi:hypothetical protein